MFERFTDRSRRVVALAQEEARLLGHNYIGNEHLLLGLVHEGEGVAARALDSLGIALPAVRNNIADRIGRGGTEPSGHIPFTPRAKKVLELSLREALQLGHNYIGTEHILLGILREGEGMAAQVLLELGAELSQVRERVVQLLAGYTGVDPSPSRTVAVQIAEGRARVEAEHGPIRSHHLLLGLLDEPQSLAAKILASLGVDRYTVEQRAEEIGVTDTSDELPDEAGARTVTLRVTDDAVVIEIADPEIADLLGQAMATRTSSVNPTVFTSEDGDTDFRQIWTVVKDAARAIRRHASEPEIGLDVVQTPPDQADF